MPIPQTTPQPAIRSFPLDFSSVILEQPHLVSFEDVDLSRASFLYTNLSQVRFIAVTWHRGVERLWRLPLFESVHFQIGDHVKLREERDDLSADDLQLRAALVADVYRQLRLNLEGARQEIEAGHFYIGQMDMRLMSSGFSRPQRAFLWAYRYLAMYGQSAWRPLLLYLLASSLFGLAYMMTGTIAEIVDHQWVGSGSPFFLSGEFWKATVLAASAGALIRESMHGVGGWGALLVYLNMVVDIFLIALFIVALRRHFHR